jgi:hypothetical protein
MDDGSGLFLLEINGFIVGVIPEAGWAFFFVGDKIAHGGKPLDDNTEIQPRLAIAFSYKDPAKYKGKPDKFRKHRKKATGNGSTIVKSD